MRKSQCDGITCCVAWSNLARAFNSGLKLEAALEAARRVTTGDGDTSECKYRNRLLRQMLVEGFLDDTYTKVTG